MWWCCCLMFVVLSLLDLSTIAPETYTCVSAVDNLNNSLNSFHVSYSWRLINATPMVSQSIKHYRLPETRKKINLMKFNFSALGPAQCVIGGEISKWKWNHCAVSSIKLQNCVYICTQPNKKLKTGTEVTIGGTGTAVLSSGGFCVCASCVLTPHSIDVCYTLIMQCKLHNYVIWFIQFLINCLVYK